MATKIDNDKGFLILAVDKADMNKINSPGICDWCGHSILKGKYIAALNSIYCDKDYDEWYAQAKFYPADRKIEERQFKIYSKLFSK